MDWLIAFCLGSYFVLLWTLWQLRNRQAPEGASVGYMLLMLVGGVLGVVAWAVVR
jgi:predicted negative regulator of RcsB-dependent stress response